MLVGGNLKTQEKMKMKIRSQTTYCIGRRAHISEPGPSGRNQAQVRKYVTGTDTSSEYPSKPQKRENLILGTLDPPSHKNIAEQK